MSAVALSQFRKRLYELLHLYNWADTGMDLIDALSCAQGERSVVELSLQPAFRGRHYSGLFKAIGYFPLTSEQMMPLFARYLPLPQGRPFRLLAVDTVPHPRPYAACLEDRGFIHAPNPTPGQKPVAVGHVYSLLAFLPEREAETAPPWAVFLDAQRVATDQNAVRVAREQVSQWLQAQAQADPSLLVDQTLVEADSRYSTPEFIYPLVVEEGTNGLVRLRGNRVVFCPPRGVEEQRSRGEPARRGHPRWYGQRFDLGDPTTWPKPDVEETWTVTDRRGRTRVYHLQAWREMRMRGTRKWPMYRCPFTLIRVWVTTPEGERVYPRSLWATARGASPRGAGPVRPPAERMAAAGRGRGIPAALLPRARPPLSEAEPPGNGVSDTGGGARGAVVVYPGAGGFPVVAGPEDEPARAPAVGAVRLPAARRPAGRRDPVARPGSAGVWANYWADRQSSPSAPTPRKTPGAEDREAVTRPAPA